MRRDGLSRRELLTAAAGLALGSSLAIPRHVTAGLLDRLLSVPPAKLRSAITPNDEFYVTSYRSPADIRVEDWALTVKGLVQRPIVLTYAELRDRPLLSEIVTLECVGNGLAADAISTAEWQGASLKALLDEAGVSPAAYDVVFRAADGYSDSIPVARAMAADVLIAYRMNGVPLPRGHGFPARIIVPGIYGMKNVQWLTEIELVEQDYKGYYQRGGWSDDAVIKTSSHIDVPGHGETVRGGTCTVQGYAFAGTRGITLVEISTDEGRTWNPAELQPPLSPFAWVFWTYRWPIPSRGRHTVTVRATDGTGRMQSSVEQAPYPDGAAGLHEITVKAEA